MKTHLFAMLPSSPFSIVSPDMSSYWCFVPFCNKIPKRLDGIKITDKLVGLVKEMRGESVWNWNHNSKIPKCRNWKNYIHGRIKLHDPDLTSEFMKSLIPWCKGGKERERKKE